MPANARQQEREEPRPRDRLPHHVVHRVDLEQRQRGIERGDRLMHRRQQVARIRAVRAQHHVLDVVGLRRGRFERRVLRARDRTSRCPAGLSMPAFLMSATTPTIVAGVRLLGVRHVLAQTRLPIGSSHGKNSLRERLVDDDDAAARPALSAAVMPAALDDPRAERRVEAIAVDQLVVVDVPRPASFIGLCRGS